MAERHTCFTTLIILFVIFNYGLSKIFDGDILPEKLFTWLFLRVNEERHQIKATYCDEETCYSVIDWISEYQNGTLPTVLRTLTMASAPEAAHSMAFLKPKETSFKALLTDDWIPDTNLHVTTFNEGISKIFEVNNVISRTEPSSMLFIGLGGGGYPAYFRDNYPKVNQTCVDINPLMERISIEWFGIVESDLLRIEIADGTLMVQNFAKEGIHYDGVILDATYSNLDRDIVSPVDVFREEKTVESLAKILGENGMLAINVVPGHGRDYRVMEPYNDLLRKHFKYVASKQMNGFNTITICSQREVSFDNLKIESDKKP